MPSDINAALESGKGAVIPFPGEWQASCDDLPIWWDAEQVAQYVASSRKLAEARKRAKDGAPPGMLMMSGDAYVEAAICGELNKLDGCQHNQDQAMITAALALAGMVKGWGLDEAEVSGRFFDVCDKLADLPGSGLRTKGRWRRRHFEEKWRNAMRDAEPRAPRNGGGWNGAEPGSNRTKPELKGKLDYGLLIWKEGQPLKGTPGERYFREARNIDISDEVMARMRFHPRVECKALEDAGADDPYQPAILNIMTKGFGGEIAAIHATFVGADGAKPDHLDPRKQCFGRYMGTGAAIYLAPPGDDTVTLEGIEKTVAVMNATGFPGVTGGSGAGMKGMAVDPEIRTLHVGADWGGEDYAKPLAARAHEAGHEVKFSFPPVQGEDWDDCEPDAVRAAIENAPLWAPAEPAEKTTKPRFQIIRYADIKPVLIGQWLIKRLLPAHGLAVVYGPPGCGKSFLTLDAVLHIAYGVNYGGLKVKRASVLYIAAEGQDQFCNRIEAARNAFEERYDSLDLPRPEFGLITVAPNLGRVDGDAAALIKEIKAQSFAPNVIVIDTISKALCGANENVEGMGAFIANAGLIQQEFRSLNLAVHHTGKDEGQGMRGWSGLHGGTDMEIAVNGSGDQRSASVAKMRDGSDLLSWGFKLEQVKIGEDEDGDPVTSCIVNLMSNPSSAEAAASDKPEKAVKCKYRPQFKQAFEAAILSHPVERYLTAPAHVKTPKVACVNVEYVRAEFYKVVVGMTASAKATAFSRALEALFGEYPQETDCNGIEWIWRR